MSTETVAMSTTFEGGRAVAREQQCAELRVVGGPCEGESVSLESTPLYVGRSSVNDLVVEDEAVSGSHFAVEVRERGFLLRDLDSRNGTHLEDCRVREVFLEPGVPFRAGRSAFVLAVEDETISRPLAEREAFHGVVGRSPVMRELFERLSEVAGSELSCLITGETGTGKERVARAIHSASDRSGEPFEVLDCSAIPSDLMESRVFGHERGAFTGAVDSRQGVFERADGGTVFLDEIGDLDLSLQPKLLRVLENGAFQRVGGEERLAVDVRVVAATNREIRRAVGEGEFREDLFFRLAVAELRLPPLDRRREDIPLLADHFLAQWAEIHPEAGRPRLAPGARRRLRARDWPGNVRQLKNAVRRAASLSDGPMIESDDLAGPPRIDPGPAEGRGASAAGPVDVDTDFKEAKRRAVERFERRYLERVVEACDGNVTHTAERAGLSRYHARELLKKHDLLDD